VNPVIQHREWLIQPDALHAISASYQAQAERAGIFSHQSQQNSLLSVEDGIGVVAIEGPILRKADLFAKMFYGATSSEEIAEALQEISGRDDIKAVLLNIDSPGGTVAGTPELANAVAALDKKKPVYAFSSGLMCSAAYWVASHLLKSDPSA
jgi:ClpP class serine protease